MHLVMEGFLAEAAHDAEDEDTPRKDSLWWAGYAMGLLQAGYLTQKEHDYIVNELAKMFSEKGGE